MLDLSKKLELKLSERRDANTFRTLPSADNLVDFSSNDYLGFANNETIFAHTFQRLLKHGIAQNGATGSRLLSGNHRLYTDLEMYLGQFHCVESALVFNSGYDANLGFFSAVPQRNDIVFYDEYIHASIRDGIKQANAKSYKFKHNDLEDLKAGIERIAPSLSKGSENTLGIKTNTADIYVVTEAVFSMDGDSPDLKKFARFCSQEKLYFVVDEAHAVGVLGKNGIGLIQELGIENEIFARIITFGKAIGCHGAAILGGSQLKNFLVNFARSFIYTTGLSPHAIATALSAYAYLDDDSSAQTALQTLRENIVHFKTKLSKLDLKESFIDSNSAIQCCLISGNEKAKSISKKLVDKGFNVKAILSPTVPEGEERLRFCLHSFNSKEEIGLVLQLLKSYL